MSVKGNDGETVDLARVQATLREATDELQRFTLQQHREHEATSGLSVQDLIGSFNLSEEALAAFVQSVGETLGERPLSVQAARRAGVLAATEEAWENELGPLLSSAQVREVLDGVSRQRVDELLRSRRLIGLRDRGRRLRFPAFQFADGRPNPGLIAAFWTVADAVVSDWTAASWCVSGDEALKGRSPVGWLREKGDPDRVQRLARQDAARLGR